jgi:hypothetical protein
MACDPSLSEVVLAGLPSMFVVNIANDPAGRWLADSIQFSVREAGSLGACPRIDPRDDFFWRYKTE